MKKKNIPFCSDAYLQIRFRILELCLVIYVNVLNKLDINNDKLKIKFNRGELKYMAYLPDGTPVFNLNARSRLALGKKNKELLMNPILLNSEMQSSMNFSRYDKLNALGFPCDSFEVLYSTRDSDMMASEMIEYLRKLTSEEDVLIGIHRTGQASLSDIENILRYGLVMTGLNNYAVNSPINLRENVSYYPNNETIIKELINADTYKNSLGAILIRIPDEELDQNIFMVDTESLNVILDPMYIVGFVPVGPDGYISEIITPYQPADAAPFKNIDSLYEERTYARDIVATNSSKK